jgi:branched-chain amino acid transport system substrate-binding protein
MSKNKWFIVALLFVFALSACAAPAVSPAVEAAKPTEVTKSASTKVIPDEIKIGVTGSMSGDQAVSGKAMVDAIALVKKELDSTGGLLVDGKKVKITFVVEDCESKPEISINAVQKLISQDHVLAIIGPNNSSDVIASGAVSQAAKIPQITHTGTNVKVTQVGDYIFRECFIDPFQGKIAAKFAAATLKATKVAVLWNNADAYSEGLREAFVKAAADNGMTVVADQVFTGYESKDYSAQLTIIKAAKPEVLFLPNDVNTVPLMMQQARRMGIVATFLGGDAWDYAVLPELAGTDIIEGSYYVTGFSPESPSAADFAKQFEALAGYRASFASAMCYEAAHVVLNAIQRAATIDGTGIRDAMLTTDLLLPSGRVVFDKDRNPIKGAVILNVIKGTPTYFMDISLN